VAELAFAASPLRARGGGRVKRAAPQRSVQRISPRCRSHWFRESSALSKRVGASFGRRTMVGDAARFAGGVEIRTLTMRRSLDQLPVGETGSGSSGCLDTQTAKGSRSGGWLRSPSLLFRVHDVLFERERSYRSSSREAPSGLRFAPTGLRGRCGAGQRGERRCGAWGEKPNAPFLAQLIVVAPRITLFRRVL
jgi:hypothetical protein